jgi:hypothetical protein
MKIKIKFNVFKKYVKPRTGLTVEVDGEGSIDIVPSREENSLKSFIYFEGKERKILTENNEIQLEVADDEEISILYNIENGMFEINIWGEESPLKNIQIPVKSTWRVDYRNRRSLAKISVNGSTICCTVRRKG